MDERCWAIISIRAAAANKRVEDIGPRRDGLRFLKRQGIFVTAKGWSVSTGRLKTRVKQRYRGGGSSTLVAVNLIADRQRGVKSKVATMLLVNLQMSLP